MTGFIILLAIAWLITGIVHLVDFLLHLPILLKDYNPRAKRKYKIHSACLLTYFLVGSSFIYFDFFTTKIFFVYAFIIPIGLMINWIVIKKELKEKVYTEEIIDDLLNY